MQEAIDDLWTFTDELFHTTKDSEEMIAEGIGVDLLKLKANYYTQVSAILEEATIKIPSYKYFQKGGKEGIHTEHLGYILSDLQYMQRTFPNMEW
jgi:ring-1,2-phenylacetyl-CoA epoxidase subunit PaaC